MYFGEMLRDYFIINVPAQMRSGRESWYVGTADAIFQSMGLIEQWASGQPDFRRECPRDKLRGVETRQR